MGKTSSYIDHIVIGNKCRRYVGGVNGIRREDACLISSRLMRNAVEIQTGTVMHNYTFLLVTISKKSIDHPRQRFPRVSLLRFPVAHDSPYVIVTFVVLLYITTPYAYCTQLSARRVIIDKPSISRYALFVHYNNRINYALKRNENFEIISQKPVFLLPIIDNMLVYICINNKSTAVVVAYYSYPKWSFRFVQRIHCRISNVIKREKTSHYLSYFMRLGDIP